MINNLEKFYNSREEVINFLETILKCYLMLIIMQNKIKLKEHDLKYQHLNKCNSRLPIVLAQLKAGNNLDSFLNEIRQIIYSLYRSKQITKKVCNNIIKSIQ